MKLSYCLMTTQMHRGDGLVPQLQILYSSPGELAAHTLTPSHTLLVHVLTQRFIYDFKLLKESIDKERDTCMAQQSVTSLTSQLLARVPDSDPAAISLEQLLQLTPKEILHQDNCM